MPNEEQIQNLIDSEKELAEYSGDDKIISSFEAQELAEKNKTAHVFSSPFQTLNDLIEGGFESSEVIIVGAYPKHGKTSFCLDLLQGFTEQDINCLFFSFEMPPRQLFPKFEKLPLFYLPQTLKDKDLDWLENRILEAKIKYDCRIVFIDHLGFVFDLARSRNIAIEMGAIVRRLKTLARENELLIFLVHHTVKEQPDKPPTVADLRDSGLVTAEADSTIMMWRLRDRETKEFGTLAMLSIENYRRVGLMGKKIKLEFNPITHRFKEYDASAIV